MLKNICVNYVKICVNVWFKNMFKNNDKLKLKWYL